MIEYDESDDKEYEAKYYANYSTAYVSRASLAV